MYNYVTSKGDLYYSITLPALIMATYGGGTSLATQRECLELMGCYGKDKAYKLIEIAAAMVINLVTAAFTGAILPLLMNRANIDPALAGSVVLTTVTDVVGFLSFLGLATIFYA